MVADGRVLNCSANFNLSSLTRVVLRGVWTSTSMPYGKCFVASPFTLLSQRSSSRFLQAARLPWKRGHPSFLEPPQALGDAGERLLVNYKPAVSLVVHQEGCNACPLTYLLKCSASQSQTLELRLLLALGKCSCDAVSTLFVHPLFRTPWPFVS